MTQKLLELQARALKPLIERIAESVVVGDELAAALIPWVETAEGQEALRAVLPELLGAIGRVVIRDEAIAPQDSGS